MKIEKSREQLNDYFAAELDGLRTSVIEFAEENPSIAQELALNKHSEGKSKDPHIEMLIQSFAWMTSRLRQNIESESAKLPSMLLQQLYPQLVSSIPSMAIAECHVDGFATDFDNGYRLNSWQHMEPIRMEGNPEETAKLSTCKLSTCHDLILWPLKVASVKSQPINDYIEIEKTFNKAQSMINLEITETDEGAAKGINITNPLRFYLNFEESERFKFYDYIARYFIGAVVYDEDEKIVTTLSKNDFKLCGFEDDERLFPASSFQDLGFSLLQDYFCFPEKFMFFELSNLKEVQLKTGLNIKMVFSESIPKKIKLKNDSVKLNCVPVINLFEKTSEPIPLHHKSYRYRLHPSRVFYNCHEIIKVHKLFTVNKKGENKELLPYFSLDNRGLDNKGYRWLVQQETSHKKSLAGTESWLSLYDQDYVRSCPLGETLYAETLCCNRTACELFPRLQAFSIVGSSPVTELSLLTRPTRHKSSKMNSEHLWKLLSHFSIYYVSLTDKVLAKDILMRFLSLYASQDNPVSQRQIESIEKLEVEDDVQADLREGWRGYYHGTKFTLTLIERKFEGSSAVLFGHVIYQFLALFCHINSFVRLELKLGSRSIYQWQPMSGHKVLV
ncbi:type VI secretion system baseplate subunit TssF [Aliikangiella sp. IMCC44359]|uniref:type VI secretion system baseplate subunit TssF n=1 Tax=Aliikangiella sp. IMCC44359 TaxID=3459125 RepID=UPI00403AF476